MSRQSDIRDDGQVPRGARIALIASGVAALVLLAGALALWRENGLGVYMERLASGIVNCF